MIRDKLYDLHTFFVFTFFYHPILKILAKTLALLLISCFFIALVKIDKNKKKLLLVGAFIFIPIISFIYDWCSYPYSEFDSKLSNSILNGNVEISKISEVKIYKLKNDERWPTMIDLTHIKPELTLTNKFSIQNLLSSLNSTDEDNCEYQFSNIHNYAYVLIFKSTQHLGYVQVLVKERRSYVSPLSSRYEFGVHGWPNCNFISWIYKSGIY
jgi:hypothetical protein